MWTQTRADSFASHGFVVGIAPLVVGIVIVAMLIAAVWLGKRIREGEPGPSQDPQARSGAWQCSHESDEEAVARDHGPGHQDSVRHEEAEVREPEQLRSERGKRRLPHDLGNKGSRTSEDQDRRRWDEGKSGSFGGG